MIYNVRKMDDQMFRNTIEGLGRTVTNYYTNETDVALVEPNGQLDGGKIYCKSDSWIRRGDIIKVSGEWYVVNHLSNLASEVFNCGIIQNITILPLSTFPRVHWMPTRPMQSGVSSRISKRVTLLLLTMLMQMHPPLTSLLTV